MTGTVTFRCVTAHAAKIPAKAVMQLTHMDTSQPGTLMEDQLLIVELMFDQPVPFRVRFLEQRCPPGWKDPRISP